MKKIIFAALLGGASLMATTVKAEPVEWTLAYLAVKGTIYEEVALAIPERIATATDGQLVITANSSLIKGSSSP